MLTYAKESFTGVEFGRHYSSPNKQNPSVL